METITVPLHDYVQRADDEGRDYHAYRTVAAAAERWVRDRSDRAWAVTDPDKDSDSAALVFSRIESAQVKIITSVPDVDMGYLYLAAELPFTIKPEEPFAVGDYIKRKGNPTGAVFRVTAVTDDGYDAVYVGGRYHDGKASMTLDSARAFDKVENPTIEYVVTAPARWTAEDITRALVASDIVGIVRVGR